MRNSLPETPSEIKLGQRGIETLFDTFFGPMLLLNLDAEVAQLVEQPIRNRQVDGSNPPLGSILQVLELL